jgi:N-methylhydantoinase B
MKSKFDPASLEIYKALYTSVAEEMGVTLRRTAFSPNIKERRDYSCAVYDGDGRVIAQADHMPVHLGSMPMAVAAALREANPQPGDIVALNDPFSGGTHLPDVTLVAGVFLPEGKSGITRTAKRTRGSGALFYVANRAHHADIGGATPGSMGTAVDVYAEGLRIPPIKLVQGGEINQDIFRLILSNVRGSRERRADFEAQIGSLKTGTARLLEIVERRGIKDALTYASHLIDYSSRMMRTAIRSIPDGYYEATDILDSDGEGAEDIPITVRIDIDGDQATVDFTGSALQVAGAVNAVEAITVSAVAYVFRCLVQGDVPASAGLMEPVKVIAPLGTIVNARPPAPVAGGNVETSQRIVDVLLRALSQAIPERIPAASQGTMNNLTIGGMDPASGAEFSYYETIAGGMGARAALDGMDAVHTHMTNSLNTPAEALEYAYPLRVRSYSIRRKSGGGGRHRGGDGVIREIETLTPARMSLLSERREHAPYGADGGQPGQPGLGVVIRDGKRTPLESKCSRQLEAGDIVRIETPGGGGYGER